MAHGYTVGIQKFANDISLSDAQIDTIVKWVDGGAVLGDAKDMPPPVQWAEGSEWRLSGSQGRVPDLIVKSTAWTQPAEGQDQWWQPVVDSGLTEDRWIRAVEVRPSVKGRRSSTMETPRSRNSPSAKRARFTPRAPAS